MHEVYDSLSLFGIRDTRVTLGGLGRDGTLASRCAARFRRRSRLDPMLDQLTLTSLFLEAGKKHNF